MTAVLAPLTEPEAYLSRRNPAAKLGAAMAVMLAAFVTVDPVTPTLLLAGVVGALGPLGVPPLRFARRAWPLAIAVPGVVFANAVFSDPRDGAVLLDLGPLLVTTGDLGVGVAAALRILAIGLPGLLVAVSTDPVDLADSLVQQLRAPARFAYGALAAIRLIPILGQEWTTLGQARRARGVDAGRNPIRRVRLGASQVFVLLVGAIRRGSRLAVAMDARGFDARVPRTAARIQRVTPADWGLIAGALAVALTATATALIAGTWRFPLG